MSSRDNYDVIVIGSGIGVMTRATALSRMDHKVLPLEQAQNIGGLTHTFSREGFTWDGGLHYCDRFRSDQPAGTVLDWLSGGEGYAAGHLRARAARAVPFGIPLVE